MFWYRDGEYTDEMAFDFYNVFKDKFKSPTYTPPYDAPIVDSPPAPPPATGKVHLYDWDEASGNWTELPLSPLKGDAAGDLFGYGSRWRRRQDPLGGRRGGGRRGLRARLHAWRRDGAPGAPPSPPLLAGAAGHRRASSLTTRRAPPCTFGCEISSAAETFHPTSRGRSSSDTHPVVAAVRPSSSAWRLAAIGIGIRT